MYIIMFLFESTLRNTVYFFLRKNEKQVGAPFAPGFVDPVCTQKIGLPYKSNFNQSCPGGAPGRTHGCIRSAVSSLGRYVFGSEISYNKAPPRLPGLGC
jgi:hypothetical protein